MYKDYVTLYDKYREEDFEILAFPCNQFGKQEPGTKEEIRAFVDKYGVKFPMFKKIDVNGSNADPLWKFLKAKQGGFMTRAIKWNFTKFIVDKNGNVLQRLSPTDMLSSVEDKLVELMKQDVGETNDAGDSGNTCQVS